MHHRMDTILKRLRQDVAAQLSPESIRSACNTAGHKWRKCLLDPVAIVHWFIVQILHGNTSIEHVSLLANRLFTGEAYCRARMGLPLAVFQILLKNLVKSLVPETLSNGLWRGHRTLLIDGSSFSMPDTPELQKAFGQPGMQTPGCGFPVAKILALFHAGTGLLLKITAAPLRTHDMSGVGGISAELKPNDVLVGDRGFCSFAHMAMLVQSGFHAVFRMHQQQIVDFTPHRRHASLGDKGKLKGSPSSRWLRSLGVFDQLVEWFKPKRCPSWMTAEEFVKLPDSLIVRELRYEVERPGFRTRTITLVTTLLDAELYPLDSLAELYLTRWQVELNLRHLKITMGLDVLKCKTVDGVLKELTVYAMVYNLVCLVIVEAAGCQVVSVERISFVDALRWLAQAKPGDELPELVLNPIRFGRVEPRVKKRRPKSYPLMNKPRGELRKQLRTQELAA